MYSEVTGLIVSSSIWMTCTSEVSAHAAVQHRKSKLQATSFQLQVFFLLPVACGLKPETCFECRFRPHILEAEGTH